MRWIILVFLLISCQEEEMKQFLINLPSESQTPPLLIPTGISYVGTRQTTGGSGGQTGHVQGVVVDESNDRVYISWTSGVSAFRWSDLAYLYKQDAVDDGTGPVSGTHIGDIALHNGFVYGGNAIDFFDGISPNRNVIQKWRASDLVLVDSHESLFQDAVGAMASDGTDVWVGYGNSTLSDGFIQKMSLTTMEATGSIIEIPNVSNPTDFGDGIQSFAYFSDKRIVGFCDYNSSAYANTGSNVKIANMEALTYDLYRDLQKPYDYGIDIVGNKMYLIEKGGGTSDTNTDILEFNILYDTYG